MKFKIIGGSKTFVFKIESDKTVSDLYDGVEGVLGDERFLFKGMSKGFVERSEKLISEEFSNLECIYAEKSNVLKGPVETATNDLYDKDLNFSILEVPGDNSCLFHSLSDLLNAKSSGELRKIVANEILKNPKEFSPYIEKAPFEYSNWIQDPTTWGGAPEITIISKIYKTKVCVIQRDLVTYGFGDEFRSVVYLSYSGSHYNAVIAKTKSGSVTYKFPCGDKWAEDKAKEAVRNFFGV
ncbi:ubiquitin thioesterase OTU1 [Nematocida parisii]|uniref:Ubiquitin thioesterase OTU n=1 Tax=Nematocida parisii (strain ERTm3) TaxID=935791 RepID=I3EFZ2_NEMP3|nr:uncharacterized protein NEPG_01367 [Nematocida parisii ERTm1]EIJ88139.1 hypothetical protein NEQG_01583 [Nematocida parisii ERTm3]KAI5130192.1 ubiquitin thioesterase OTU1 [Nematocida parisii]EIJ93795.1 hypothetical protein NEPG_01367 [Nematocida parisii ERTm1]KAI5130236.1 ubiquitin thioesterase OTU1 [Nematocida parisii]KAI5143828.1 ubiquitin thioesterase OTU1 [Nematocida parisii]|eukprot:XP_013059195.1 hypothetical protein NEPG_01367 [Nematocida parisii ERTm1]